MLGGSASSEHAINTIQDLFKVRPLIPYGVESSLFNQEVPARVEYRTPTTVKNGIGVEEADGPFDEGVSSISDLFKIKMLCPLSTIDGNFERSPSSDVSTLKPAGFPINSQPYSFPGDGCGAQLIPTIRYFSCVQTEQSAGLSPQPLYAFPYDHYDNPRLAVVQDRSEQLISSAGGSNDTDDSVLKLAAKLAKIQVLSEDSTFSTDPGSKLKRGELRAIKVKNLQWDSIPAPSSKEIPSKNRGKELSINVKRFMGDGLKANCQPSKLLQANVPTDKVQPKRSTESCSLTSSQKLKVRNIKKVIGDQPRNYSMIHPLLNTQQFDRNQAGSDCIDGPPRKPHMYRPRLGNHRNSLSSSSSCSAGTLQPKKRECVFCKTNGETPSTYRSHVLKNEFGQTVCHVLQQYTCPCCGASGKNAHTLKYCPINKKPSALATMNMLKSMRLSTGKLRTRLIPSAEQLSKFDYP